MKRLTFVTTLLALSTTSAFAAPLTIPDPVKMATESWQQTGTASAVRSKDGQILFPFGESEPLVTCAVNRVCDIELQAGETIANVAVGDSARWYLQPAGSGAGAETTPHVILKPTQSGLKTNLILTTDKRTYYLKLESSDKEYMTRIGFYYPKELVQSWNKAAAVKAAKEADKVAEVSPLEKLDFAYSIIGTASFRPERVFNDGVHVYIQMPPSVKSAESPALMLEGKDGKAQLVNYRISGSYYIIDRLFEKAVLVTGVGNNQQKITLIKKNGDSCFLLGCVR